MKKSFLFLFVIILAFFLIITSCTQPSQSTTTAPASSQASLTTTTAAAKTTAAPAKTIELKWADHFAPASDDAKVADLFCTMVEEGTKGKVKLTPYHAETLVKSKDLLVMLERGVCDAGFLIAPYFPGQFDLFTTPELPGLGIPNRFVRSNLTWELFYSGYFKDLDKFKILGFKANPPQKLWLKNKKVLVQGDFKGLKIQATNQNVAKLYESLGATPVSITGSELYMSLDRGLIDGLSTGYDNFLGTKLYEIGKYGLWNFNTTVACMPLIMNKSVWNGLPSDVQSEIDQVINNFRFELDRFWQDKDGAARSTLKGYGVEIYDVNADEIARWQGLADPILKAWIAQTAAKGLPTDKMIEDIKKIVSRYQ